jgi:hypothetical protein
MESLAGDCTTRRHFHHRLALFISLISTIRFRTNDDMLLHHPTGILH